MSGTLRWQVKKSSFTTPVEWTCSDFRRGCRKSQLWTTAPLRTWLTDDVIPSIERFSNDCRKTKTKVITLTNHNRNGTNSAMNQSEFLVITCNSLEAREKSRVHGASGFGFASNWLKNWRESFQPITKRSNRNHVITFNSHLKSALIRAKGWDYGESSRLPTIGPRFNSRTLSHTRVEFVGPLLCSENFFPGIR